MLHQILTNTPLWAFGLFFALLALGIVQMRPRTAPMRRIIRMHASYTLHPHVPAAASLLYGVLSGAFTGRAWKLFQLVNPK